MPTYICRVLFLAWLSGMLGEGGEWMSNNTLTEDGAAYLPPGTPQWAGNGRFRSVLASKQTKS